jgi:hypothetical protein
LVNRTLRVRTDFAKGVRRGLWMNTATQRMWMA